MNFAPYHQFAGCDRLEEVVRKLHGSGAASDALLAEFDKYHFSLTHKLQSAHEHVDALTRYLGSIGTPLDHSAMIYRVNFHFDGFLQSLGSGLDIFAREMLTYFGIGLPNKVYHITAHQLLSASRPAKPAIPASVVAPAQPAQQADAAIPFLALPTWKQEFSDYRNTATHERLIGIGFTIHVELKNGKPVQRVVFPIPDDPRAAVRTFTRNKDIVEYCAKTFKRAVSHVNQAYVHVEQRAKAKKALPI